MTYDEWYQQNYADSPVSHADYTFGEEVWKAAQTAASVESMTSEGDGFPCYCKCHVQVTIRQQSCKHCNSYLAYPQGDRGSEGDERCVKSDKTHTDENSNGIIGPIMSYRQKAEAAKLIAATPPEPAPSSGDAATNREAVIDAIEAWESDNGTPLLCDHKTDLVNRVTKLMRDRTTTEREAAFDEGADFGIERAQSEYLRGQREGAEATRTTMVKRIEMFAGQYESDSKADAVRDVARFIERTPLDELRKGGE